MLPAVAVTLATPEASVCAALLESMAVAPAEGAVKVTVTPLQGLPAESVSFTFKAIRKGRADRGGLRRSAHGRQDRRRSDSVGERERGRHALQGGGHCVTARLLIGGGGYAGDAGAIGGRRAARQ